MGIHQGVTLIIRLVLKGASVLLFSEIFVGFDEQ